MNSERELVAGLLAGDQLAWMEWGRLFRPVLTRIARREFRLNPEDIEDLWQDLLLSLLDQEGHQLKGFRREAPLRSWLCAIWRHRCLDFKRRQTVRTRCWPDSARLVQVVFSQRTVETRLLARQALDFVGERDRVLLQMHFMLGWSQREPAARLRTPETRLRSYLRRAKLRIRRSIDLPAVLSLSKK